MNKSTGFTLIDLLVTVAIASIVLTLGVPAFQTIIHNNRMVTETNGLVSALNLARSEAIKRGVRVTVCKVRNQNLNNCTRNASINWENGWLVFADLNSNGRYNGGEPIIQGYEALTGGNTLRTGNSYKNFVSYLPSGRVNNSDTFRLCDDRGTSKGRSIVINAVGRVRVQEGTSQCP